MQVELNEKTGYTKKQQSNTHTERIEIKKKKKE